MEDYSKFIRRLGQLRNRKIMVEDAKDKYPISNEQLDTDIYLFNCQNGTFNLSNFKLQPHNPDDLISKISNVIYNPHSKSNVFSKFISEVLEMILKNRVSSKNIRLCFNWRYKSRRILYILRTKHKKRKKYIN